MLAEGSIEKMSNERDNIIRDGKMPLNSAIMNGDPQTLPNNGAIKYSGAPDKNYKDKSQFRGGNDANEIHLPDGAYLFDIVAARGEKRESANSTAALPTIVLR